MCSTKIVPFAAMLLAAALAAPAFAEDAPQGTATLTVVHKFGPGEGLSPYGGVLVTPDGTIYGTTRSGSRHGRGLVYKLTPGGFFKVLHAFGDVDPDGSAPVARPTLGPDGMLYGTTEFGTGNATAFGTVWRVATDGSRYEVLHAFPNGVGKPESAPYAELALANDGRLYGTTIGGGDSPACSNAVGCGVVFSIGTDGSYQLVHSFSDVEGTPFDSGVVQMHDGRLAGVNNQGGVVSDPCGAAGCGTVYAMTLDGQTTVLHAFTGADGRDPLGTPVVGADGTLHGVTRYGGQRHFGVEWHLDTEGGFAVDATFNCSQDACRPNVGLSPAPGRYGSTDARRGSAIVDHNAHVIYPGLTASGPLAQGPDGALYGTSLVVGPSEIFRLQPN
jgi:uncharacterized repeat protein (TIGR03803 family)